VQVNEFARDLGKGWLLLATIGLCALVLGRVDVMRISRPGRFYLAYAAVACVAAVVGPAWLSASFRAARLGLTVVAVFLVCEIVSRSGGDVIEAYTKAVTFFLALFLVEAVVFSEQAWRSAGFGTDLMRLQGVIPPLEPNAIGELSGVVIVLGVIGIGVLRPRVWVPGIVIGLIALVLTITRIPAASALVACIAGLAIARRNSISRRVLATIVVVAVVAALFASSDLLRWMKRDQPDDLIYNVTGRTPSWVAVFSEQRATLEMLFGEGLGAKVVEVEGPIGYLSINSSWLAAYQETGLIGVGLLAVMLVGAIAATARRCRYDPRCALGFGLLVYLLIWSLAETGLDDTSTAVVNVLIASSVLVFTAALPRRSERDEMSSASNDRADPTPSLA
jgi:hypothetical protein